MLLGKQPLLATFSAMSQTPCSCCEGQCPLTLSSAGRSGKNSASSIVLPWLSSAADGGPAAAHSMFLAAAVRMTRFECIVLCIRPAHANVHTRLAGPALTRSVSTPLQRRAAGSSTYTLTASQHLNNRPIMVAIGCLHTLGEVGAAPGASGCLACLKLPVLRRWSAVLRRLPVPLLSLEVRRPAAAARCASASASALSSRP